MEINVIDTAACGDGCADELPWSMYEYTSNPFVAVKAGKGNHDIPYWVSKILNTRRNHAEVI